MPDFQFDYRAWRVKVAQSGDGTWRALGMRLVKKPPAPEYLVNQGPSADVARVVAEQRIDELYAAEAGELLASLEGGGSGEETCA